MINITSISPAEYKKLEESLKISYDINHSPFGQIFIAVTENGICALEFVDDNLEDILKNLNKKWEKAVITHKKGIAEHLVKEIFYPETKDDKNSIPTKFSKTHPNLFLKHLNLFLKGTPFQIKVWKTLLSIPLGKTSSYSEIAKLIGNEKAVRAVATAIAQNPIGYIIPCHRVIRKEGILGNYHWGSTLKNTLLQHEAHLAATYQHL